MPEKEIEVVAYSGARGEENPRAFFFRNERINVVQVLDMWIEERIPGRSRRRWFEVKGSDGYTHRICYDEVSMKWFMNL